MNRNNFLITVIGTLFLWGATPLCATQEPHKPQTIIPDKPVLSHPTLAMADGTDLQRKAVGLNMKLSKTIREMHFGIKSLDGVFEGIYNITSADLINFLKNLFTKGTRYSIRDFSTAEAECDLALYKDPNNTVLLAVKEALRQQLELVKNDFANKVLPYSEHNHFGDLTLQFIEESCKLRKRTDSFMLTWGKVKRGEEKAFLQENMRSFRDLDIFCSDLINFLSDFIHSCPKTLKELLNQKS